VDPDGTIESTTWYFGDGESDTGFEVSHSYDLPGAYSIYVEVVDNEGAKANSIGALLYLSVERPTMEDVGPEAPPVAIIATSESIIEINNEISFDGSSSYQNQDTGNIETWSWDFGDDTTSEGTEASHTYTEAGSYLTTLTVKDITSGKTDAIARTVVVVPEAVPYEGGIRNPDTLILANRAPVPSHMELLEASEIPAGRWLALAISDTLLSYQPGTIKPTVKGGLAESYEMTPDGKIYTFHLREGVKFWDGTELKAEDVVYTFQRSIKIGGRVWGYMIGEAVTGIKFGELIPDSLLEERIYATDDYTVVFELEQPYAPFLSLISYMGRGIIQKKAAVDAGSWYIGDTRDWLQQRDTVMEDVEGILAGEGLQCTGAYKIIEWSKGQRILLERNEDYWQGPAPIKYVKGLFIPEWATRFLMLKMGDIDMTSAQPAEAEQVINLPPKDEVTINPVKYSGWAEWIYINTNFDEENAPVVNKVPGDFFSDIHMRKAFAYAFPYDDYIEQIYLGWAEPAKGALIPGWPGYHESFPYEHDLEKAEEEFKLAWDGKYWEEGFTVAWVWEDWAVGNYDIMGQLLAEELAKVNPKFKMELVTSGWPDILDGSSPIVPFGMQSGTDPYYLNGAFHSEFGYAGDFGYKNEEVDRLLQEAQYQTDPESMEAMYIEAQKLIGEDLPGIMISYSPSTVALKSYLQGVTYNPAWACYPGNVYFIEKR
jgi:peptide/nickel transport system substrate-binding protein